MNRKESNNNSSLVYFQMFKQPLEEMAEDDNSNGKNQALLNNTELKIIFGNLPPIYELHQ